MNLVPKMAIGLMSGTSCDGVDAALIETDGEKVFSRGPFCFVPYGALEQKQLKNTMKEIARVSLKSEREDLARSVEALVRETHVAAIEGLLKKGNLRPGDIDVIGFHGQTLYHDPKGAYTLQVGDGERLARQVGIPVVYDFRSKDMEFGGEGAPLVPIYHHALVQALVKEGRLTLPVAVVNIGGVANVTYLGSGAFDPASEPDMLAFDTGPGNALINDWVETHTGELMDEGGRYAAAGVVDEMFVSDFLDHPYFSQVPPKSLDRDQFTTLKVGELSLEDGAATLAEITVKTIALSRQFMADVPEKWIIVGGGAFNSYLMRRLSLELGSRLCFAEDLGWQGDQIEAEAFGFLAVRHLADLPFTFPKTTGVSKSLCGGEFASL